MLVVIVSAIMCLALVVAFVILYKVTTQVDEATEEYSTRIFVEKHEAEFIRGLSRDELVDMWENGDAAEMAPLNPHIMAAIRERKAETDDILRRAGLL